MNSLLSRYVFASLYLVGCILHPGRCSVAHAQPLPEPVRSVRVRTRVTDQVTLPTGINLAGIVSPNGRRFAFLQRNTAGTTLLVDGHLGTHRFDQIRRVVFSQDSRRFSYIGRRGGKDFLVLGDRKFGPFDELRADGLAFTPDGAVCIAIARQSGKDVLIANGESVASADEISPLGLVLPPSGSGFLFLSRDGELVRLRQYAGSVSALYTHIIAAQFSADGLHIGFLGKTATGMWQFIMDGLPRTLSVPSTFALDNLYLNRNAAHFAVIARDTDNRRHLIVDGTEKGVFDFIHDQSFSFSPDGLHFLFVAETAPESTTVSLYRDGNRLEPAFSNVLTPPLRRPDRPEEYLMVIREAATPTVRLVRGDQASDTLVLGPIFQGMANPAWSPTGGHTLALATPDGTTGLLVVDGVPLPAFSGGIGVPVINGLMPRFTVGRSLLLSQKKQGNTENTRFSIGSTTVSMMPFRGIIGQTLSGDERTLTLHFLDLLRPTNSSSRVQVVELTVSQL